MSDHRQLRMLVAPFFFILSLLWGLYFADDRHGMFRQTWSDGGIPLVGVIVASSIPIGFLFNQISILLLGTMFWRSRHSYEVCASRVALSKMCVHTGLGGGHWIPRLLPRAIYKRLELYIDLSFSHGELSFHRKGVFEWLSRVWNAFTACVNSAVALVLSGLIGSLLLEIPMSFHWWCFLGLLVWVNVITAIMLWHKEMLTHSLEVHRWQNDAERPAPDKSVLQSWRRELRNVWVASLLTVVLLGIGIILTWVGAIPM